MHHERQALVGWGGVMVENSDGCGMRCAERGRDADVKTLSNRGPPRWGACLLTCQRCVTSVPRQRTFRVLIPTQKDTIYATSIAGNQLYGQKKMYARAVWPSTKPAYNLTSSSVFRCEACQGQIETSPNVCICACGDAGTPQNPHTDMQIWMDL